MDTFSFVMVAYSMIIGLAITVLLSKFGQLIQNRRRIRFHWLPVYWALMLFLIQVQVLWSMWGFRSLPQWHLFSFFLILLLTVFVYLPATVVLPDSYGDDTAADLLGFFNGHRRAFFILFAFVPFVSFLINAFLFRAPLLSYGCLLPAAAVFLLGSGAAAGSGAYQAFLPVPMTAMVLVFLTLDVVRL
ncbi:MAG TPA: hypothetical protein PKI19_04195 [Elusimicrobiales bacterium]|nr:hypothetical protein [Elusimicrobiales bacterium]